MTQKYTECQNDGTKLVGDYCHTCGQRADEPRRVVIGLVQDFLVDTLAIDGKLARTIWLLLSRPGRLARRYLDGKRVRYSPPFRLYLFASVFFFLTAFAVAGLDKAKTLAELQDEEISEETLTELEEVDPEAAARVRQVIEEREASEQEMEEDAEPADKKSFTEQEWDDENYSGPEWLKPYAERMYVAAQQAVDDPRLLFSEVRQNLPRTLLLAPVVYAFLLMLLYIYRRKYYVYDHFVISLYMHAALYAYLLLGLLISMIPVVGFLAFVPLAWGWFQPFLVFRQAYGSGWISAFLKWTISITIYFIMVIMIITFGLTYSLYQSG